MRVRVTVNRTIVRFLATMHAATLWGCAATARVPTAGATCAVGERLVCETFAGERDCDCASLERTLAAFGTAAWPGGNH